ncbi:Protein transport Sec1a [Vitis vinifera]|uniref:Protein transport Sec1a n=1 Tax=Vitis vinifera TaxID=29760 RepID=A0A438FCQ2_VITVI|nr:Protein transport Sec1a [Vitis vinifera]
MYLTSVSCLTCSVVMFLSDMSGRVPLYKKYVRILAFHLLELSSKAFVFFSSPIPKDVVNHIKSDTSVLPRIDEFGVLSRRQSDLAFCLIQTFITDHERALEELLGENVENTRKFDNCLNTMATRISTIFASLRYEYNTLEF